MWHPSAFSVVQNSIAVHHQEQGEENRENVSIINGNTVLIRIR